MVEIIPARSIWARRAFFALPKRLYQDNSYYLAPATWDGRAVLSTKSNPLLRTPHAFLLARTSKKIVARILTGVRANGEGYFSLFDAENFEAAQAVLDAAVAFQRAHGSKQIIGPIPPSILDYGRGILCEGFDLRPSALNVYNPSWYAQALEDCGFERCTTLLSYSVLLSTPKAVRYRAVGQWAADRFDLRVEADLRDPREICRVLRETGADDELICPESPGEYAKGWTLLQRGCPDVRLIAAYAGERPVGYLIVLPDGEERARLATIYVAPDFHNRGATVALLGSLVVALERDGVKALDLSLIDAENADSRRLAERAGGVVTHQYREYRREIEP